ncbi:GNAT family N-acetyltransferase [Citricoccus sp. NPDC055426]|uniref:GNAT family N-acetyltransferase n=1 Tax=Citricoccus sp. NPDC055426 TaxID=3155536 RepID=UPI0034256C05
MADLPAHPVSLRPLRVEDAPVMTSVLADPSLYEFTGGHPPSTAELERQYTVQARGHSADHAEDWVNHLVLLGAQQQPVGYVQATLPRNGEPTEIAWVIGRPWQGRGIAGHAAALLLRELARRGVREVIAHIHPEHRASQHLATGLGLTPTSTVVEGEDRWEGRLAGALSTGRLRLRPPDRADVGPVLRLLQDPRATEHNPADALQDVTQTRRLMDRWAHHWWHHGIGYYAVTDHDRDELLGICGVKAMTLRGRPVANLLSRIDPAHWDAGIATEATRAVIAQSRDHWPDRPVIARIRPENHASARVAGKLGLVRAPELDEDGEDGPDHLYVTPR